MLLEPIAEGDCSGKAVRAWCGSLSPLVVCQHCAGSSSFTLAAGDPSLTAMQLQPQHSMFAGMVVASILS